MYVIYLYLVLSYIIAKPIIWLMEIFLDIFDDVRNAIVRWFF